MSVRLFSVRSRISRTTRTNFTEFSEDVTGGRGSVLLWRHFAALCTSGFRDDVMFLHIIARNRRREKRVQSILPNWKPFNWMNCLKKNLGGLCSSGHGNGEFCAVVVFP